jgi:hypothetical protein
MKNILAVGALLLLPNMLQACDVCGIFLSVQPHDRTSSISMLWRFRHLEGNLAMPGQLQQQPKHAGHGVEGVPLTGNDHYRELYQVLEVRADLWLGQRVALMASVPLANNYRAVNSVISTDIYGLGDPFFIARYQLVNTRNLTEMERTVHRLMLGAGAKLPIGRDDVRFLDLPVAVDMQPGTGTLDLLASAEYTMRRDRNGAAVTVLGRYNQANATDYRLGHGISTTVEFFRRWDLGNDIRLMPALGMYHELAGMDAEDDTRVQGTGSSTLFSHFGTRLWWRNWMLLANLQVATLVDAGELMVPNRMRIVAGLTYNLIKN